MDISVNGSVELGFEPVRDAFETNFETRGELGAACTVYHRGQKVVDLWGGHRDRAKQQPWREDTLTIVFSSTKGMASLAVALAHSRGYLNFDEKVSTYWPEFAQAGKAQVTVRQLLAHQAGLCVIDEPLTPEILADLDHLAEILAAQKPAWEPGTEQGYHAISLGWYQSELLRRVDPQHRSLGVFFRDEIAGPLDLEFYIGLPDTVTEDRIATIQQAGLLRTFTTMTKEYGIPGRVLLTMLNPKSLAHRAFMNPKVPRDLAYSAPAFRVLELPSVNGMGDARSLARAYSVLAMGGHELGIREETLKELWDAPRPPTRNLIDRVVVGFDGSFSLGFMKPLRNFGFASSARAFGMGGAGGSFAFADPDARLGFAYVMNQMGAYIANDPRERALRDATYYCLARFGPGD